MDHLTRITQADAHDVGTFHDFGLHTQEPLKFQNHIHLGLLHRRYHCGPNRLLGAQHRGSLPPVVETTGPWQGLESGQAQSLGLVTHDLLEEEVAAGARGHHGEDGAGLHVGLQLGEVLLMEGGWHGQQHHIAVLYRGGIFGDEIRDGFHSFVGALKVASHSSCFLHCLVPFLRFVGEQGDGRDFVAAAEEAGDHLRRIATTTHHDGRHCCEAGPKRGAVCWSLESSV
mmetsp:Transcript_95591/g.117101  ORF Transcript_95591/g.117101 Transcript_95591/m.117101 type:complete len:228 (-) Transcript_95591:22-705(-)